jgi:Leucine-rich repeat (LRR) protein
MKKFYTQLLLSILCLCSFNSIKAQVNKNDSLALVDLFNSTKGRSWYRHDNWLTGPVSKWFGIILTNDGTRVEEINLYINNLRGILPSSLGNLTKMTFLNLGSNQLSGNIPSELSNLSGILYLNFYNNELSGNIPSSFSNLVSSNTIDLSYNQLSGNIPAELGNLTNITYLGLNYNQLSGNIPIELGNLTNVTDLELENNQLSGNIPAELGNLTNLIYLVLQKNQLSGNIPAELGNLTNLTYLSLNDNQLSGKIPPEIGNLSKLQTLYLQNNQLTGRIPGSFEKLENLQRLNLSNNGLGTTQNDFLFPDLIELEININHFTFDGIETLAMQNSLSFTYSPQGVIPFHLNNNEFSVYAGGTLSNNTYYWFKDGSLIATIQGDSTFTPNQTGSYTVRIKNSIATALTLKTGAIYFNALRSSNENGIVSDQMEFNNILSVYPNPATSLVTVTFNLTGNCIVKLIDNSGQILQTKTVNTIKDGNKLQLDVSKYAAGIYLVSIMDEHNKTEVVKLNKE